MTLRKFINVLIMISLSALLNACDNPASKSAEAPYPQIAIDPVLREYYQDLGGEETMGVPISQTFKQDSSTCQYVMNGEICYDPFATNNKRFYLYPIGNHLPNIAEPAEPVPNPESGLIVNGYLVPVQFVAEYNRFGGPEGFGMPLTNPHNEYGKQQLIQYFEKGGFYHRFKDKEDAIYLLPYGVYACGPHCSLQPSLQPSSSAIIRSTDTLEAMLIPVGWEEIIGNPLTEVKLNELGEKEQVFETVVVTVPVDDPKMKRFRAITRLLDMHTVPASPRDPNQAGVVFHATDGELGYHVPLMFEEFIASHGGMELSGLPIADTIRYSSEGDVIRQCFENYCLDFHPEASPELQIRVATLGTRYVEKSGHRPKVTSSPPPNQPKYTILVEESKSEIANTEPQQIKANLYDTVSKTMQSGVKLELFITHPDRKQFVYTMPPTGTDGWTSLTIAAMPEIQSGTVMKYEVCLEGIEEQPTCKSDSFLVWNSP